ncbi:multicopper oxidase domain-containing protein [Rhizobium sp. SG2393]|uniref:multicopper oxidase domain-containing protein n=1 Tax=Rhizobium sp. SG2393 TaxID=3276279 RepID=UPI003670CED0
MTSTPREYDIVAFSIPVVYTPEGDHDPNGMVFVHSAVVPLLEWCKSLWYETRYSRPKGTAADPDDEDRGTEILPRLHHRRQRARLVIDGLERLDAMIERLEDGTPEDQALLAWLAAREERPRLDDCDHYDSDPHHEHDDHRRYHATDRDRAVRMNVERQLTELQIALTDLQRTKGLARWNAVDAFYDPLEVRGVQSELEDIEDPEVERPVRLVSLTRRQRQQMREHWTLQEKLINEAIASWFHRYRPTLENQDLQAAATKAGLADKQEWLARLIFNDHTGKPVGPCDRYNPMKPIPLLRPLVLRACVGEEVRIKLTNHLSRRHVGLFVQGHVMNGGPHFSDGSFIGDNLDSRCPPRSFPGGPHSVTVSLKADAEGVWPINDLADLRGNEDGTNTHGLFGALIVEPEGTLWLDQETGDNLTGCPWANMLDVVLKPDVPDKELTTEPYVDYHTDKKNGLKRYFREFTVFIHDEPEIHSGLHTVGDHSLMPLSYRAAPMHNRYPHRMRELVHESRGRKLPEAGKVDLSAFGWALTEELDEYFVTARDSTGKWLEKVAGEEQHHSSWLFGDPLTHVQRAYKGDPCRVRLVHAGVKETHVYHLHVHEWHAVGTHTATPSVHGDDAYSEKNGAPNKKGSHLLDSITISPQTGMTIDPLFGSGSRQHAIGDIIWHCHLYPHFHHGMWGLWRSYDRLVDGSRPYPDGSHCPRLFALPDREVEPSTLETPGFPWFIDGVYPSKSPPPPAARPEHRNGRRIVLGMPDASAAEVAAMAPGCRDGSRPGALFVDLDACAERWNEAAELPPPRKISYDIEVRHDRIDYNVDGWFDPNGHHYRLMGVKIWEKDEQGAFRIVQEETFAADLDGNPEPCFPRANHGDIVEWRQHNILPGFVADQYDFGQLPVECGLHVHLVKFDVLAADGSSTGWNYLSGASAPEAVGPNAPGEMRNVSLHRWVVDEEFGPCFFHDHLLANFRQKRGLFSALMVQPHGSQWTRHDDQGRIAWHEQQAVIVPPASSKLPPYREACLAVADYIPMLNRNGKALNPPPMLSGMSDPGVMGVNYRCAPLRFRGPDPSAWFSSAVRDKKNFAGDKGDPDTPIIRTYPGERLRIRLIQGSHEEQHSFTAHGLRWRRDWGHPQATLVNQQTLGISEAFTLDINPQDASPYGVGDHLWHFGTLDDFWLGNWGFVRVLPPTAANHDAFKPLPALTRPQAAAPDAEEAEAITPPPRDPRTARTYLVVAQRHEHRYVGDILTDPWGLIYRVVPCSSTALERAIDDELKIEASGSSYVPDNEGFRRLVGRTRSSKAQTPLVLRALAGEWVRIILVNDLLEPDDDDLTRRREGLQRLGPEPAPARLPTEHRDWQGHPDRRTVSPRVSIHASLLRCNVLSDDGSFVGLNPDTTVAARRQFSDSHGMHGGNLEFDPQNAVVSRADHTGRRNWREYWWYADEQLAPATAAEGGMGQVCYLHDMADIRNHRHHGLIGALVVLPRDVRPYAAGSTTKEGWTSFSADIRTPDGQTLVARETFWFMQDGLRFFVNGSHHAPMPDAEPGLDPVDCGQKAVNYRSYPVHHGVIARGNDPLLPDPILKVEPGDKVWLRVLGANDKPRQHGVVVHAAKLKQAGWIDDSPLVGALSGISPCRVENFTFTLEGVGDHAVRPGSFLWATQQGMWAEIKSKK